MSGFVSRGTIEEQKEARRKARTAELAQAKLEYEQRERLKEKRKARGEDQWMVPGFAARIASEKRLHGVDDDKELSGSNKKKRKKKDKRKKEKKRKSEKKHKYKDRHAEEESSATTSDSDSDQPRQAVWVEAELALSSPPAQPSPIVERDSWMIQAPISSFLSTRREPSPVPEKENEKNYLDKPGQHPLELNPYWKDGGTGLPSQEVKSTNSVAVCGDGGRSWLQRAYRRAVEQAEREGRSLEEVAAERWGSLEKLESMLATSGKARDAHRSHGNSQSRHDRYSGHSTPRFAKPNSDERLSSYSRGTDQSGGKHPGSLSTGFRQPDDTSDRSRTSGQQDRHHPRAEDPFDQPRTSHSSTKEAGSLSRSDTRLFSEEKKGEEISSRSLTDDGQSSSSAHPSQVKNVPVEPITEAQLNALGAKIMRAELSGNKELAERLQKKLVVLQECKKQQEEAHQQAKDQPEDVVLTRTDRHGNIRPVMEASVFEPRQGRRKRALVETHTDGQRKKYFDDDDKYSLSELVAREKASTAEDVDDVFRRLSGKFIDKVDDDQFTLDDMFEARAARQQRAGREEERDHHKAIKEHHRTAAVLDKCRFCVDNPQFGKHLVVAMGMKVYLAVPEHVSLTDGHCLLSPVTHSSSMLMLDEDVVAEVNVFKKGLVAMFKEQDEDVVFLETCFLRKKRHLVIECLPLPKELGDTAPIYFKKAILESEEEWAENKKLVDTRGKGLRRSIPSGFSYFAVDFGLDDGFAHVIEDDSTFPPYFGREIIGGMLDAEPQLWRRPRSERFQEQKRKALQFHSLWEPFDWTKRLQTSSDSN